ncbi:MAG: tRNA uridine-5-carboxymethylaminomethyl(34) synthesis enzyme MnmG, partial [Alphaproteobacteria bacterium]|nr:tRNA uridine-5-carboxymethylaminomethyl(34) synthesis enzyme MnmG [Alphaproteobacteria bacterium]
NADLRLTQKGYDLGLVGEKRYQKFKAKKANIDALRDEAMSTKIDYKTLKQAGIAIHHDGTVRTLFDVMGFENVSRETLNALYPKINQLDEAVVEQIIIESTYHGYIKRQQADIEVFKKDENLKIRDNIDYTKIGGLSREIVAKLTKVRPSTIGEASRIPGMTPAAIVAVLGYLKKTQH